MSISPFSKDSPSVMVQLVGDGRYDKFTEIIREGIQKNYCEEKLMTLKIPVVHFNHYCSGKSSTLIPAEFAVAQSSLRYGTEFLESSLIDPGRDEDYTEDLAEMFSRCRDILHVPIPPYTYKRGVAYSVGEDRYDQVLRVIKENVFAHRINGWKVIFTLAEYIPTVNGCLKWLSWKCDDHLGIGVFPLEIIACEMMRMCRIHQLCRTRGLSSVPPDDDEEVQAIRLLEPLKEVQLVLKNAYWNTRLRLGCHWHQRQKFCDGLRICSNLHVKKWCNLLLYRGCQILNLDFEPFVKDMRGDDIYPSVYKIEDAKAMEARQRLGMFGEISSARRTTLEDGFIFPDFLEQLKQRFPDGLTKQPKEIVWPVNRSIEVDLNYSKVAKFRVKDPDPAGRAAKREMKLQKDEEKALRQENEVW